jgi:hypothetical protein
VLYSSLDFDMVVLYVFWFFFIDYLTANPMLAIFITYLVELCFKQFRASFGKHNLANKSMLDDRFLM